MVFNSGGLFEKNAGGLLVQVGLKGDCSVQKRGGYGVFCKGSRESVHLPVWYCSSEAEYRVSDKENGVGSEKENIELLRVF